MWKHTARRKMLGEKTHVRMLSIQKLSKQGSKKNRRLYKKGNNKCLNLYEENCKI